MGSDYFTWVEEELLAPNYFLSFETGGEGENIYYKAIISNNKGIALATAHSEDKRRAVERALFTAGISPFSDCI